MRMFIDAWNAKFQTEKYPINFYLHNLQEIQTAKTPEKLGEHIIALLHWKDGKVKKDVKGDLTVGNDNYILLPTKPNTFHTIKHKEILVSERFYYWARDVINLNAFVETKAEDLKNIFHLYGKDSIVMPTFILHILSPLIYPLYDQHVERAKRAFLAQDIHFNSNDLNLKSYKEYHHFFKEVLIDYPTTSITDIKKIDNALWSFGKWLKSLTTIKGLQQTQSGDKAIQQESVFLGKYQQKRDEKSVSNPGLTEKIRKYIISTLVKAKEEGKEFIDMRSADIHKAMGLQNRMPDVCNAMESLGVFRNSIIKDTPSGKSSTKVIRYYLRG